MKDKKQEYLKIIVEKIFQDEPSASSARCHCWDIAQNILDWLPSGMYPLIDDWIHGENITHNTYDGIQIKSLIESESVLSIWDVYTLSNAIFKMRQRYFIA